MAREKWGSKLGFMLASMGSAVGLGNIWRFSYVAGENGGGAFLLLYLLFVFIIGIPVLLAEFSIGREASSDVVGSYRKLAPKRPWYIAGGLAILSTFLILGFYGVIAGWALYYMSQYVTGALWDTPPGGYAETFASFTQHPVQPLFWHALFLVLTIAVVLTGVKKGIEKASRIFMPALALMLIALAVYSVTLEGGREGLAFLFQPDWSSLTEPSVYLAALGQAFFSLSIGVGIMMTYGGYLSKRDSLPSATVGVGIMDTLFAVIAGVMIFPAVFAFGIEPTAGAELVFITMPGIFQEMAGGAIVGFVFFLLLVVASLSSAISLLEVPVSFVKRKFGWSRAFASVVIGVVMYVLGVVASLGMGRWAGVTPIGDYNIMDSMDYLSSNILLPIGGLAVALFVGWQWKKNEALRSTDMVHVNRFVRMAWYGLVKYVAPILIVIIFLSSIGLI
ncbi:Na+-dependent transporter [Pontibacillus halophilus JSM 076056 = DSM 19796]|uniref:Na+-dependent transporter n=1 Tax=Pontibacillus halophilus JSM 076056 = DSM 19796 TaxID=1385510 RepID=A0A0A5GRG1_9BACI|nr:sodium-dependent transporter [Pontibacillus halophilus]KGX93838.1 Na+-dependent transporter [Pontibacillus halophilus JSM 076056 = DSM 19796]